MVSYQRFANEIAPNMHHVDTFHKIQDLGSKKQVREYLNTMREEVCKEHMSKIYGVKRTEKLMHELEYGLRAHKERLLDDNNNAIVSGAANDTVGGGSLTLNNLRASQNLDEINEDITQTASLEEEEEEGTTFDEVIGSKPNESIGGEISSNDISAKNNISLYSEKEEEGEEAAFDEVVESTKNKEDNTAESIAKDINKEISSKNNTSMKDGSLDSKEEEEKESKEESPIVEFSQSQQTCSQEQVVLDASQNVEETQTIVPTLTQNSSNSLILDSTQSFDETQTIVLTMAGASQEANHDFFSQEY